MFLCVQVCVYVQVCVCVHAGMCVCVCGGWRTTLVSGLGILSSFFVTGSIAGLELAKQVWNPEIHLFLPLQHWDRKHVLLHQTFYNGPGIELRSQDKHLTLLTESSLQPWFGPLFFFFFLLFGMGVCTFVSVNADTQRLQGAALGVPVPAFHLAGDRFSLLFYTVYTRLASELLGSLLSLPLVSI